MLWGNLHGKRREFYVMELKRNSQKEGGKQHYQMLQELSRESDCKMAVEFGS